MKLFKLLSILIIQSYVVLALTPINCPETAPEEAVDLHYNENFLSCDAPFTGCTLVKVRTFLSEEGGAVISSLAPLSPYPLFESSSISVTEESISTQNLTEDAQIECIYANAEPSALIAEIAGVESLNTSKLYVDSDNYSFQDIGTETSITLIEERVTGNSTITLETDNLSLVQPTGESISESTTLRVGAASGNETARLTIATTQDGETETKSFDIKMNFSCTGSDCSTFLSDQGQFIGNLVETELCEGEEHTGDVYGLELYRTTNSTNPVGYIKIATSAGSQTQIFKITENNCLQEL